MRPGQRNSLDALCRSYGIDNSHRELHGALLDAEILADVYLMMTGGQTDLMLMAEAEDNGSGEVGISQEAILQVDRESLSVIHATADELNLHNDIMDLLDKKSDGAIWRR